MYVPQAGQICKINQSTLPLGSYRVRPVTDFTNGHTKSHDRTLCIVFCSLPLNWTYHSKVLTSSIVEREMFVSYTHALQHFAFEAREPCMPGCMTATRNYWHGLWTTPEVQKFKLRILYLCRHHSCRDRRVKAEKEMIQSEFFPYIKITHSTFGSKIECYRATD